MRRLNKIQQILQFIRRENLHRLLLMVLILVAAGTTGIAVFEPDISLKNALWYTFVTITTVGYGDFSPITQGGRFVGLITMVFGIGILGLFTGSIASILVEKKIKRNRGMHSYEFENHIIICEWNHRTRDIIRELRMDPRSKAAVIILIAEIESKPIDDENLYFIHGSVNEDNLKRANIQNAKTVLILGDDRLDTNARDAKAVLTTLTVETINPAVYTIVELVDENNVQHCERANADEIIVGTEFSSKLISRATLDHGISKVLSELLSPRFGNELYKIPVPSSMEGKDFIDIFSQMKRTNHCIVLAVQKKEGKVILNPLVDYRTRAGDYLIVVAADKPQMWQ